jgi:hypothetical protein
MTELTQPARPQNPLLERLRIPGETYRLPSQGQFYTHGELDDTVKNGEVEVYPMTAIDEIVLSTPDKLLSGKAITEIFIHCIPQIKKPEQLLAKDVDFLMVCLRMVSFGQFMEVVYTHDCDNAKEHTYNIDLQQMLRETKQIDATSIHETYVTTLKNGQVVHMRPLTYGNIIELYSMAALNKTDNISQDEAELLIINTLASVISDVDGIEDPLMIREWVIHLPLGWKRELEQAAQKLSHWGVDFTTRQVCKDCKKDLTVQVSANPVSFFT